MCVQWRVVLYRYFRAGMLGCLLVLLGLLGLGFSQQSILAQNVRTCGYNNRGQLGDGTTNDSSTFIQVGGLSGVTSIAGGAYHSLALMKDGTVWAWGVNLNGQLGDGTTTDRLTPVQVSGLTSVIAIAGGDSFSMALKSDGTVWAWGFNTFGQLGDGSTTEHDVPIQVSGLTSVTAIAAREGSCLALKKDGTVWAWGWNASGQLGDGTTTNRLTPVQVSGLTNVIAIAASQDSLFGLALKSDGTVWAWGSNEFGQLGDGTTTNRLTPVQVSGLTNVNAIAAGEYHSLALKSDGTVWAWGDNEAGQLGDGTTTDHHTPVQVSLLSGITVLSAGAGQSLALKSDGTAWNWGWNQNGQLGDGTTTNRLSPVQVSGLTGLSIIALQGGGQHTLALVQPKTVGEDPDINQDGSPDLIWQNSVTGDATVWYMNGPAWSSSWDYLAHGVPTAWKIVGSHDFNGDGSTDLIWQNSQTGDVTVWYMDHTTWTGRWDYLGRGIPSAWKIVGLADLNGDNKTDLIWQNSTTGDVTVWFMNGAAWTGNWAFIAQGVPIAWKIVGTADLNADGNKDLIWQNVQTGDVTVWYMNGSQWTGQWSYIAQSVPTDWKIAAIMDTDNDHKADFIWQNNTTGDVTVWFMDGAVYTGRWSYIAHNVPTDWKITPTH